LQEIKNKKVQRRKKKYVEKSDSDDFDGGEKSKLKVDDLKDLPKPTRYTSGKEDQYQFNTARDILQNNELDPESNNTIALYFINLVTFILTMLVFYGLVSIIAITLTIYLYDYTYNYEDLMQGNNVVTTTEDTTEFKTQS